MMASHSDFGALNERRVDGEQVISWRPFLAIAWIVFFAFGTALNPVALLWARPFTTVPVDETEIYWQLSSEEVGRHKNQDKDHGSSPPTRAAFVMVAHSAKGDAAQDALWGYVALARSIQRLSTFPMLMLTDISHFPDVDRTPLASSFAKLNVEVRPLRRVAVSEIKGTKRAKAIEPLLQTLQIWSLTDYDKLVFLDPSVIVYRNVDWLFTRPWMWAARDEPSCQVRPGDGPTENQNLATSLNAGVLLLRPNASDFRGLVRLAATSIEKTVVFNDIVRTYFNEKRKKPVNLLSEMEAGYGQCLGSGVPSPYRNKDGIPVTGVWNVPAFVYSSGGLDDRDTRENLCFSVRLERQHLHVGGGLVNACQYHMLSAYWRQVFCSAANDILQINARDVASFCNDRCYYQLKGVDCQRGLSASKGHAP